MRLGLSISPRTKLFPSVKKQAVRTRRSLCRAKWVEKEQRMVLKDAGVDDAHINAHIDVATAAKDAAVEEADARVTTAFAQVSKDIAQVLTAVGKLESRMEKLEKKLDSKFAAVETKLDGMKDGNAAFRLETTKSLAQLEAADKINRLITGFNTALVFMIVGNPSQVQALTAKFLSLFK